MTRHALADLGGEFLGADAERDGGRDIAAAEQLLYIFQKAVRGAAATTHTDAKSVDPPRIERGIET